MHARMHARTHARTQTRTHTSTHLFTHAHWPPCPLQPTLYIPQPPCRLLAPVPRATDHMPLARWRAPLRQAPVIALLMLYALHITHCTLRTVHLPLALCHDLATRDGAALWRRGWLWEWIVQLAVLACLFFGKGVVLVCMQSSQSASQPQVEP